MNRLPVIGSTAKSTAFCHARVDGPGGHHLFFDGNGKVTAANGTLAEPRPNAFSLRNVEDCPQSTATCRAACYVENLRAAQPDLYALYEHNARTIREILVDPLLASVWASEVAHWIDTNASGGFRWHVSGDIFSLEYAEWIAEVCRRSLTRHWIYTRSFDLVEPLTQVSTVHGGNLALNLSCDVDNYAAARETAHHQDRGRYGADEWICDQPLRLCYLTTDGFVPDDLPADSVIFPDYQLRPRAYATLAESPWWQTLTPAQRGLVCPVDAMGKSEKRRCGLDRCDRCLT